MNKSMKMLGLAVIVLIAALAIGCKKDSTTSRSSFLTKNSWTYTSITDNGVEDIADCEKDDVENYTSAGAYTFSKGADDCGGGEDDFGGTWKFIDNDTKVVYDASDTVNVLTLDDNTFKFNFTDDLTVIYTLKH